MKRHLKFNVDDPSISGEIRRTLQIWSEDLSFDKVKCGALSIVINELVTNILKHAERGELIATMDERSIAVIALDRGPGISDISKALSDGFSSAGTAGNGLGAIRRLSSEFDIFSQRGKGTIVLSKFNKDDLAGERFEFHGFSLPLRGESVSGDGWDCKVDKNLKIVVCDGLGHGLLANEATRVAIATFDENKDLTPLEEINRLHLALRSTRGAAISVASVDEENKLLEYCGLGNIVGSIVHISGIKRLISYNGTAGVQLRKIQSLPYPLEKNALVIFHSDGLSTHWNILEVPGLYIKHPLIIAGLLYRDHSRGTDDVTVVVGR